LLFGGFGYAHLRLFSPVRSTIGFDRLFDLAETAQRAADEGYRPYDIERLADDRYQITLAVAGFSPDEISITAEQNVVTIEGGKTEKTEREFLYRGISGRHFKRQFNLADYVQVKGANFDNGLLKVELVREIPEAMKPRRIAISGASSADNSIRSRPRRRPDTSASGMPRVDRRAAPVFVRRNGGEHAADDHNVFDLNALLHPGRVSIIQGKCWRIPRCRFRRSEPFWRRGRCIGDRVLSRAAGTRQPQGAHHHRRDPRGDLRTRRRTPPSAGRQAEPSSFDLKGLGSLISRGSMDEIRLPPGCRKEHGTSWAARLGQAKAAPGSRKLRVGGEIPMLRPKQKSGRD
jgi:molecular chaperone IbpA